MALPIDRREGLSKALNGVSLFQQNLTEGELYRAAAVYERAVEVRVNVDGQHQAEVVAHPDGLPTIYRRDNQASPIQTPITILYQAEGPIEDPATEVVLLGAVRTDQLDQAVAGFVNLGYPFGSNQRES